MPFQAIVVELSPHQGLVADYPIHNVFNVHT